MRVKAEWMGEDKVVNALMERRETIIDRHIGLIALDILRQAKAILSWHKRTGALERGLRRRRRASLVWELVQSAAHDVFFREGTKPHPIYPRVKKALWWPGLDHPIAKVENPPHPGTKPVPYNEFAVDRAKTFIDSRLVNLASVLGAEIVRKVG